MMMTNQKEQSLLKDLKNEEKICAEKYARYAQMAADPQLQTLLLQIAKTEQGHLQTLTQMESGKVPSMSGASGGSSLPTSFTAAYGMGESDEKKQDGFLCNDLLATEKHASSLYNACIFEFRDPAARQRLNHIQKEEQEHGKALYDYMQENGMYS